MSNNNIVFKIDTASKIEKENQLSFDNIYNELFNLYGIEKETEKKKFKSLINNLNKSFAYKTINQKDNKLALLIQDYQNIVYLLKYNNIVEENNYIQIKLSDNNETLTLEKSILDQYNDEIKNLSSDEGKAYLLNVIRNINNNNNLFITCNDSIKNLNTLKNKYDFIKNADLINDGLLIDNDLIISKKFKFYDDESKKYFIETDLDLLNIDLKINNFKNEDYCKSMLNINIKNIANIDLKYFLDKYKETNDPKTLNFMNEYLKVLYYIINKYIDSSINNTKDKNFNLIQILKLDSDIDSKETSNIYIDKIIENMSLIKELDFINIKSNNYVSSNIYNDIINKFIKCINVDKSDIKNNIDLLFIDKINDYLSNNIANHLNSLNKLFNTIKNNKLNYEKKTIILDIIPAIMSSYDISNLDILKNDNLIGYIFSNNEIIDILNDKNLISKMVNKLLLNNKNLSKETEISYFKELLKTDSFYLKTSLESNTDYLYKDNNFMVKEYLNNYNKKYKLNSYESLVNNITHGIITIADRIGFEYNMNKKEAEKYYSSIINNNIYANKEKLDKYLREINLSTKDYILLYDNFPLKNQEVIKNYLLDIVYFKKDIDVLLDNDIKNHYIYNSIDKLYLFIKENYKQNPEKYKDLYNTSFFKCLGLRDLNYNNGKEFKNDLIIKIKESTQSELEKIISSNYLKNYIYYYKNKIKDPLISSIKDRVNELISNNVKLDKNLIEELYINNFEISLVNEKFKNSSIINKINDKEIPNIKKLLKNNPDYALNFLFNKKLINSNDYNNLIKEIPETFINNQYFLKKLFKKLDDTPSMLINMPEKINKFITTNGVKSGEYSTFFDMILEKKLLEKNNPINDNPIKKKINKI